MTTTTEYLESIDSALKSIKTSIIAKGQTPTGDISTYSSAIDNIDTADLGYKIIVIDYDGKIIEQVNKLSGETHTLPAGPTNHPKLVFQEWASCDTITNNTVTVTDHDILVGAVYTTASGTNEFDIKLNEESGKTVKFNMTGTKNWGDGTSDTLNTHTYADYGEYTITCDGTTLNQTYLMGQNTNNFYTSDFKLKNVRLATVTSITDNVFSWSSGLETITMSSSLTSIGMYEFFHCIKLKCCVLSNHITSSSLSSCFEGALSLMYAVIPNNNLNLFKTFFGCYNLLFPVFPSNCISFESTYQYCYSLPSEIYIPALNNNCSFDFILYKSNVVKVTINATACDKISSLHQAFYGCMSLKNITFLGNLTNNTTFYQMCQDCSSLSSIKITLGSTNADTTSMLLNCQSLKQLQMPSNITTWANNMIQGNTCLNSIKAPSTLNNISNNVFSSCWNLVDYDFTDCEQIPTITATSFPLTTDASHINFNSVISVPRSLYQDWVREDLWETLKKYIYGGQASILNFTITPSDAEAYVYDSYGNLHGQSTLKYVGTYAPFLIYKNSLNTMYIGNLTNLEENTTYNITASLTGTTHQINIVTGYSNCIVKLFWEDIEIIVPESNTAGTYTINISDNSDKCTFNYLVDYSLASKSVSGTITYNNANVTENITLDIRNSYFSSVNNLTTQDYTKAYIYNDTSHTYDANVHLLFNGDITDTLYINDDTLICNDYHNQSQHGIIRYFDSPKCIKKIVYYPYSKDYRYNPTIYLFGSNDGTNWTDIDTLKMKNDWDSNLSDTNPIEFNIDNENSYNYYRFAIHYWGDGQYGCRLRCNEIDCFELINESWNTSYNRNITVTHNINWGKVKYAYVINSSGKKFNLYYYNNKIQGVFNTQGNDEVTLNIKLEGYKQYTETFTASSSPITKNITLEESHVEIDLTPGVTSYGWITSTKTNPKESEGWLMFESNMKNVDSNYAVMKVIIDGDSYSSFTCYINSYAESGCDFTYCTKLDSTTYDSFSGNYIQGTSTSSKQYPPETFNTNNWTTITYTDIPSGEHFFYVVFRTDSSAHRNYDSGFVLIDTNQ